MRPSYLLAGLALLALGLSGCPTDPEPPPCPFCDASVVPDATPGTDATAGFDASKDGGGDGEPPIITFVNPAEGSIVTGPTFAIEVMITDASGVAPDSVGCQVGGVSQAVSGGNFNLWTCTIGASGLMGGSNVTVIVGAADIDGNYDDASATFLLDLGPTITFLQPTELDTVTGAITVAFNVADPLFNVVPGSVQAVLNGIPLMNLVEGMPGDWTATFDTADPMFALADGLTLITVTAANDQGTVSTTSINVFLDNSGPVITFVNPVSGALVGDVVVIEVEIEDPSNVVGPLTLAWVGLEPPFSLLGPVSPGSAMPGTYGGQFNTVMLPDGSVSTFISVQATDGQGNISVESILVELDNARPVIELDPGPLFLCNIAFESTISPCPNSPTGIGELSHSVFGTMPTPPIPFDPMGVIAVNDLAITPQLIAIRAEVRDYGNAGYTTGEAGIVDSTVNLFVTDDAATPLIVDITGPLGVPDGICDIINPDVVASLGTMTGPLLVPLVPVPPIGSALYWSDPTAPVPIIWPDGLSVAINDPPDPGRPALYVIGPLVMDGFQDLGQLFDTIQLQEGPGCMAVESEDGVGNLGVSPPLRFCVNNDPAINECAGFNAGTAPDCTGTLVGGVVDPGIPCSALTHADLNPPISVMGGPAGRVYNVGF